ncbi:MAG: GIY-YIG nuclease family protein [Chloroflexi bacterium]|nr:GIY-YIG nuclease family protein [Chloroflexota bacterium]
MPRQGFFYIMTNKYNTVLYCGVTNNLARRVAEHKEKPGNTFVGRYLLNKLVYYELTERIIDAIEREKQIKGGSRQKKIDLINSLNPAWKDLYDEVLED